MGEATYISFYLRYNTMHVFVKAVREIKQPRYVRFLVNGDEMMMVMQSYHKKEFVSFKVPDSIYKSESGNCTAFQIHSKAFCRVLAKRLGWNESCSYRIPGVIYPQQQLVRFDLKKAVPINRVDVY